MTGLSNNCGNLGMVDLSGVLGDRLENSLAKARKLAEAGDLLKAAAAYAQAAKLMRQYADSAASAEVKKKRLADAERLQAYAEQLRQGKVPAAGGTAEVGHEKETDPDANSYVENARGLIRQAKVSWDDIAGLEDIKRFVKESYALSLAKRPEGVGLPRAANLLLYGPPGTGKTLIAAAISRGLEATFFSCKVSDMLSKYFGESTKLIDAIFDLAERMSPSVIFLDDFESVVPDRDSDSSGAERRVLTELLTCMDGFESKSSDKLVLVVAATNKPWLIDEAILSRFGKLAYIGLPQAEARRRIFDLHLTKKGYRVGGTLDEFAARTDGFSGREIEQICKELIRLMISKANPDLAAVAEKGKEALQNYTLKTDAIGPQDLDGIVARMKPITGRDDLRRYETWMEQT
jgi:katanin p60 ATPase-containing subunit A1